MEYATTQAINFILIWLFMILLKIINGLNIFVKEVNIESLEHMIEILKR